MSLSVANLVSEDKETEVQTVEAMDETYEEIEVKLFNSESDDEFDDITAWLAEMILPRAVPAVSTLRPPLSRFMTSTSHLTLCYLSCT